MQIFSIPKNACFFSKGQYHEKNHWPIFNFYQIKFENESSRRIKFLNILSSSQDIHLLTLYPPVGSSWAVIHYVHAQ